MPGTIARCGAPVRNLTGQLQALRPADGRLGQSEPLTEVPHLPGTYRTLLRLDQPGLWEFRLDTRRQAQRFVCSQRLTLTAAAAFTGGGEG